MTKKGSKMTPKRVPKEGPNLSEKTPANPCRSDLESVKNDPKKGPKKGPRRVATPKTGARTPKTGLGPPKPSKTLDLAKKWPLDLENGRFWPKVADSGQKWLQKRV